MLAFRPLKVERARKEERETQRRLVLYDTSGFGGRAESSFVQQQEPGLALLLSSSGGSARGSGRYRSPPETSPELRVRGDCS